MAAPVEEGTSCTASQWHLRYDRAADRYEASPLSPPLLDALAAGLREWASLLPQTELDRRGRHKPVNSWGLGPEQAAINLVEAMLHLQGEVRLATRLDRMVRRLLKTAMHLDECYPKVSADEEAAEKRLVKTCRMQAGSLATVLEQLKQTLFGARRPARAKVAPTAKRSGRAANIEQLRTELVEHIKGTRNAIDTAVRLKCPPPAVEPLTAAQLAERTGLPRHTVSRCLRDDAAHELRMLWEIASNPEMIARYSR
ncbi:MAG TPA: hypothetical protein VLM89_08990 [Phycisphaerae bacterium]|nr:hypothetical protein [Phycisphaerae bacterium]